MVQLSYDRRTTRIVWRWGLWTLREEGPDSAGRGIWSCSRAVGSVVGVISSGCTGLGRAVWTQLACKPSVCEALQTQAMAMAEMATRQVLDTPAPTTEGTSGQIPLRCWQAPDSVPSQAGRDPKTGTRTSPFWNSTPTLPACEQGVFVLSTRSQPKCASKGIARGDSSWGTAGFGIAAALFPPRSS